MNILALDTSTHVCTVAISAGDNIVHRHAQVPRGHVKIILPFVQACLAELGLKTQDLHYIAVGTGPGSFTGLRIAASIAQGLAFAVNAKLVPISSLQALAQNAYVQTGATHVIATSDARMQQVYLGEYQLDACVDVMQACQADSLVNTGFQLQNITQNTLVAGSGADLLSFERYQANLLKNCEPSAEVMLKIAVENIKNERIISSQMIELNYVRNEVVS